MVMSSKRMTLTSEQKKGKRVRIENLCREITLILYISLDVENAIAFLRETSPIPSIKSSELLERAALDHVNDMGTNNLTGHDGSDRSTVATRAERYCKWLITIGENIDFGNNNARDIVVALIIDDGVPSRGHRMNLMKPGEKIDTADIKFGLKFFFVLEFIVVGAAIGTHPRYRHVCVMTFAGGVLDKSSIFEEDRVKTLTSEKDLDDEFERIMNSIPSKRDLRSDIRNGIEGGKVKGQ
jgi:hypothetical protein